MRKVRRANCVHIVEEISKIYSEIKQAADLDPDDHDAVKKMDEELKESQEMLKDI